MNVVLRALPNWGFLLGLCTRNRNESVQGNKHAISCFLDGGPHRRGEHIPAPLLPLAALCQGWLTGGCSRQEGGAFCPGTRPPEEQVPCRHLLYLIWGTCGYFHNRRLCVWKFLLILPSFQLIQPVHFYTEFHLFDYWLLFLSMVSVSVIGAGSGLVWRARPQTFSRHSIAQVPLQTQAGESHHCLSPWCAHTGLFTSVIPFHQGFTKNANPRSHNSTQPFPLMLGNEH